MRNFILFTVLLFSGFISAQNFNFNCNKYAPTIDDISRSDSAESYIHGSTARFEIVAYDQDGTRPSLSYNVNNGEIKDIEYFEVNEEDHYYITYPLSSVGPKSLVVYATDGENTATRAFSFEVLELEEECVDAFSYEYLLYVATEIGANIPSLKDCTYGPLSIFYLGDEGTTYRFSLLYFAEDGSSVLQNITIDTETEEVTIGE